MLTIFIQDSGRRGGAREREREREGSIKALSRLYYGSFQGPIKSLFMQVSGRRCIRPHTLVYMASYTSSLRPHTLVAQGSIKARLYAGQWKTVEEASEYLKRLEAEWKPVSFKVSK